MDGIWGIDKLQHVSCHAALSLACGTAVFLGLPSRSFRSGWLAAAAILLLVGIAEEYRQYFDPAREADFFDAAANAAGVMAGSLPSWICHLRRKKLRSPDVMAPAIRRASGRKADKRRSRRAVRAAIIAAYAVWFVSWAGLAFFTENKAGRHALEMIAALAINR